MLGLGVELGSGGVEGGEGRKVVCSLVVWRRIYLRAGMRWCGWGLCWMWWKQVRSAFDEVERGAVGMVWVRGGWLDLVGPTC